MKRLLLTALLLLAPVTPCPAGAWMQVYQWVAEPPDVRNPPPGWESATLRPGAHFPFYAYEVFQPEVDWMTGEIVSRRLVWKRACFFLPRQPFALMRLMPDNVYRQIGVIHGPSLYLALDAADGDGAVFRLEAL